MSTDTSSEPTPATTPDAEGGSEDSQKFFATHARFAARHPTGAFDNPLTSFRYSPRPYRWREILLTVGVLFGLFIGVPLAGAVWAGWKIWKGLH